jgi:hypothetical protein
MKSDPAAEQVPPQSPRPSASPCAETISAIKVARKPPRLHSAHFSKIFLSLADGRHGDVLTNVDARRR